MVGAVATAAFVPMAAAVARASFAGGLIDNYGHIDKAQIEGYLTDRQQARLLWTAAQEFWGGEEWVRAA